MDSIPKELAAQQEIKVRKLFGMQLITIGIGAFILIGSSTAGLGIPVLILLLMLMIFYFIQNQNEVNRLVKQYVRK